MKHKIGGIGIFRNQLCSITVPFHWEKYPAPRGLYGKYFSMKILSVNDGRAL